jgi:rubrerythrin
MAERNSSEEMPEDVAAYMKYKKETGRGFDDFLKLRKDFDVMPEEQLLKEYLLSTQEGLDADDVDIMLDDYRYDEDLDDESYIKKTKIARKKAVNEAKKFFNTQKEKYKMPLESSTAGVSQEEKEEFDAYRQYIKQAKTIEEENNRKRQWFDQKTNEVFGGEFKGFEFNINNKRMVFNPGDAAELKRVQSTPANFISKFLDESGLIKDAVGYHKSLAVAMNPERFAKHFYEQGIADATDDLLRKTKNINMSERRATEATRGNDGFQVKAVNPDHGKSLKIRSIKKL